MQQAVLFLTVEDFANAGFEFMMSVKEVGIISNGLKLHPHAFNYKNELKMKDHDAELVGLVRGASHIVYCQSTTLPRDCKPKDARGKKQFLFVGDQQYRHYPERVLANFGKLNKVLYQGSDLKGKSPYPEEWLLPAIDTEFIKTKQDVSQMSHNSPIKIAHFPRDPRAKGSEVINRVMEKFKQDWQLKDKFIFETNEGWKCDWEENLARLDSCDIYIESQAYIIQNKEGKEAPLGEFGVTAMEAASLSKVVITCFNSYFDYRKEWGVESEILPANNEEDLELQIWKALVIDREKIIEKRLATREWIHTNHGRKATGERLIKLLELEV